eukprot:TRINITY_DN6115_c2_g1_i1.p1 TRINITY_DN6115_c2_g1~~TRINITY_DN6115_c2_g1_i1.p1  ORF type:complete len:918 (+),score=230.17 TRINITY_DN6115_c2_g1_i1:54-2807(+)
MRRSWPRCFRPHAMQGGAPGRDDRPPGGQVEPGGGARRPAAPPAVDPVAELAREMARMHVSSAPPAPPVCTPLAPADRAIASVAVRDQGTGVLLLRPAAAADDDSHDDDEEEESGARDGIAVPTEVWGKLYGHQRDGVRWLWARHCAARPRGALLGDDMGLGKTVQVAAFLGALLSAPQRRRQVLIVAPTTLLSVWVSHLAAWAPGLRVLRLHGQAPRQRQQEFRKLQSTRGAPVVVVTTYTVVVNDSSHFRSERWLCVVADEAHRIKNPATQQARAMGAIPCQRRIALTGTAMQNNLRELWALFDWTCSGQLLGSAEDFCAFCAAPMEESRLSCVPDAVKHHGDLLWQRLRTTLAPVALRREKNRVTPARTDDPPAECAAAGEGCPAPPEMPKKLDAVVWLELSPPQQQAYREEVRSFVHAAAGDCSGALLSCMSRLRKVCNHLRLLSPPGADDAARGGAGLTPSEALRWGASAKLTVLWRLLESVSHLGGSHRSLVFSQSTRFLDIIEHQVLHPLRVDFLRIDGTTPARERQAQVDSFNKGEGRVMLLTTQVGGVGLTLTGADRVVLMDAAWNPALDSQAVDRAYRIGQRRDVAVYRLVTCGTLEEKVFRRQVFKQTLAVRAGTQAGTSADQWVARFFSKKELRRLLVPGDFSRSRTVERLDAIHRSSAAPPPFDADFSCLAADLRCMRGIRAVCNHGTLLACGANEGKARRHALQVPRLRTAPHRQRVLAPAPVKRFAVAPAATGGKDGLADITAALARMRVSQTAEEALPKHADQQGRKGSCRPSNRHSGRQSSPPRPRRIQRRPRRSPLRSPPRADHDDRASSASSTSTSTSTTSTSSSSGSSSASSGTSTSSSDPPRAPPQLPVAAVPPPAACRPAPSPRAGRGSEPRGAPQAVAEPAPLAAEGWVDDGEV